VALVAGLISIAVGVALVAVKRPEALARANGAIPEEPLANVTSHVRLCQGQETVPPGTTAIVAWLGAFTGPHVSADLTAGGRLVGRGEHASGWTGRSVTISLDRPSAGATDVTDCFTAVAQDESVVPRGSAVGSQKPMTSGGRALLGRMAIEYLRAGRRTWLSQAPAIARHLGLGRVPSGDWAPVAVVAIIVILVGIVSVGLGGET
jgi:hypothetical protein